MLSQQANFSAHLNSPLLTETMWNQLSMDNKNIWLLSDMLISQSSAEEKKMEKKNKLCHINKLLLLKIFPFLSCGYMIFKDKSDGMHNFCHLPFKVCSYSAKNNKEDWMGWTYLWKHLRNFNANIHVVSFTKTSINHIFSLENLFDTRLRKSELLKISSCELTGFSTSKILTVPT